MPTWKVLTDGSQVGMGRPMLVNLDEVLVVRDNIAIDGHTGAASPLEGAMLITKALNEYLVVKESVSEIASILVMDSDTELMDFADNYIQARGDQS